MTKPFALGILLANLSATAPSAQLNWHVCDTKGLGTNLNFRSVACGQGVFVALSGDGTLATSSDGSNWRAQNLGITNTWMSVTYAGGRFLAAARSYVMLLSTDGTNWAQARWPLMYPEGTFPGGFSSCNDRFWFYLTTPLQSSVLESATRTNWVASLSDYHVLSFLNRVAFGGGLYVCVGSEVLDPAFSSAEPVIFVSPDASNWTETRNHDFLPGVPRSVSYGDGLFVAVGGQTQDALLRAATWCSKDGTNWNYNPLPFPDLNAIVYGDGVYAAAGGFQVGDPGALLASTDGKQWSSVAWMSNYLADVAYGGGIFVAVGFDLIVQSDPVVTLKPGGPGQFLIRGPVGRTCTIEATEPLAETNVWQTIGTTQITSDPMPWKDSAGTNGFSRFYRARLER